MKINDQLAAHEAPFPTRPCNTQDILDQVGLRNILAISGGLVIRHKDGLTLPVGRGYAVDIRLAPQATYTVRRVFARGGKVTTKGTMSDVYAEDLGEVAYYASCWVNGERYEAWQPEDHNSVTALDTSS